jgi:glycosyltransferase involved in cell wall biosynthesis
MNPVVRAAVDIFLPVSEATAIGNGLVENQLPFKIIPNFVPDDPGQTQDDVDAYVSRLPQDNYLLFVGDLSRDKGVDVLLRAYADLKNVPPLVLIGRKRPDTPAKLPNNVILMGCWPHSAVMQAWRRSSLALVPSVCPETFGIVAIEAMAMGRPVIASRIGGLTDIIIDGETGFLIAPDDSVALRRAIKRLTDNTALRKRMGQGARRRAFDFRASAVVPCIEEVYRQLTQTAAITEEVDKHGYGVLP